MSLVTLLWSSSFPIHKVLLRGGMPPLSLAGYRYFSASLILLAMMGWRSRRRSNDGLPALRTSATQWLMLAGIGFFMYTAQGVHLTALSLITASDSGLVSMTCMPLAVAVLVSILERNPPTRFQLVGLAVILAGIYIYFPHSIGGARLSGVLLNVLSACMWAVAVVMTHIAATRMKIASVKLTAVSMVTGSSLLLLLALAHDGLYIPNLIETLTLAYLVVVNTAFAFVLYNHIMKTLGAFEIAAFQDSMVIQIGILSAIFLGEAISSAMALGMLLVMVGVAVVQYFVPDR